MPPMHATLHLDIDHHVGPIDRRIFGGFVEHLGRCVYGGIFEPRSALSDDNGFRRDVLDALRPMHLPLVRYPGGNFVSSYDWRDGIGPRAHRPVRPDLAWKTLETNHFGTDEFMRWCRTLGTEPYMAVNLGNGTPEMAAEWVAYCNATAGPRVDERSANGHPDPYNVKLWALGNEMDGPWQTGHCTAGEYADRAIRAARLMRQVDPTIQTVAVGSSSPSMPTYLTWDREVLDRCWDDIDFIAAHRYSENRQHDTPWFLAEGIAIEKTLADYRSLIRSVAGARGSSKRIGVAFDEWNVWYRARGGVHEDGRWQKAPPLLEEHYTLEDAIVCAQYLAAFVRNADLVQIACLAQLVNVIAPILTRPDGLLLQPIYWAFVLFSTHARGVSLVPRIDCPSYNAGVRGDVPVLDSAASYDDATSAVSVFLINRSTSEPLRVKVSLAGRQFTAMPGTALGGLQPDTTNTWAEPDQVRLVALPLSTHLSDAAVEVVVPPPGIALLPLALSRAN